MMKIIIFYLSFILFTCCTVGKKNIEEHDDKYLVTKIKKKGSWNIIYAERSKKIFKIISKDSDCTDCKRIIVGKQYYLDMISMKESEKASGFDFHPQNYLDAPCFEIDEDIIVCIEPKIGITDLYYCRNLKGRYLVPDQILQTEDRLN